MIGLPLPPAAAHQGGPSAAANVTGFVNVESNNYAAMMTAIATAGPMAISVDAGVRLSAASIFRNACP